MRVDIPGKVDQHIELAKLIREKHVALGAASPLNSIEGFDAFGPLTITADTTNKNSKSLMKQAETAKQARDLALGQSGRLKPGTVRYFVTAARDVLLGVNKGKEKKLGDWGFVVDDSPAPAKAKAKKPL